MNWCLFQVASLFEDHPDLLEEFTCFLPDSSGIGSHLSKGISVPRRDEKSSVVRHIKVYVLLFITRSWLFECANHFLAF